jgi:hypothetical protein
MARRSHKEITDALYLLAYRAGNYELAIEDVQAKGIDITLDTLKVWAKETYVEQYEHIRDKLRETYEDEAVMNMRDRIKESDAVEKLAIQRVMDTIYSTDDPKAAAQAAYYLSQIKKNNIEKMRLMTERPTEIVEDRTAESALKSLISRGIIKPVEDHG